MQSIAITRELSPGIGGCELTFLARSSIDFARAQQQHQNYQMALKSIGCEVVVVPAPQKLADCVFIEDTALVLDEVAVMLRPGAVSRQPEVAGVADVLREYRPLRAIESPGTVDGGDLLRVGNTIFAGLSTRSNKDGIQQLREIVAGYGFVVETVETAKCLHLKSAVSEVAPGKLLINSDWISRSAFGDFELIPVDAQEAHAANALRIGAEVIYPSSFPRTMGVLEKHGINVIPVDLTELQKAEGAVTCCSLIFSAP